MKDLLLSHKHGWKDRISAYLLPMQKNILSIDAQGLVTKIKVTKIQKQFENIFVDKMADPDLKNQPVTLSWFYTGKPATTTTKIQNPTFSLS